ncbi:hypothetical protein K402DRAFT_404359 [Aulographum hederae CBS 113979]|uniref:Zn(2)-C6 fungal-type domain-containing protein n=1 Tax=Aulographum hederae CBS 113979 TaxID=1176131 RepID=A0A6G1H0R7_9PEZI|nr:hypothetical protein K402DRAFT_404359 [Aulographum hederae CBS 113979]
MASYYVQSLEELGSLLKSQIEQNSGGLIPVETQMVFVFPGDVIVQVENFTPTSEAFLGTDSKGSQWVSVSDAIGTMANAADSRQISHSPRPLSKAVLAAITACDGYNYVEANSYERNLGKTKAFIFACSDSLQNRSRKSNRNRARNLKPEDGNVGELEATPTTSGGEYGLGHSVLPNTDDVPSNGSKPKRKRKRVSKVAGTSPAEGIVDQNGRQSISKSRTLTGRDGSYTTTDRHHEKAGATPSLEQSAPEIQPSVEPSGVTPPDRKRIKRTKTECLTCRARKTKCDEGKPACQRCVKTSRECSYG